MDTTNVNSACMPAEGFSSIWLIIFAAVLIILVAAYIYHSRKKHSCNTADKQRIKDEVLNEGAIDFSNIIKSGLEAEDYCKRLLTKFHPDRFPNDDAKIAVATEISALISKNKHNLKALKEIEKMAEEKLGGNQ